MEFLKKIFSTKRRRSPLSEFVPMPDGSLLNMDAVKSISLDKQGKIVMIFMDNSRDTYAPEAMNMEILFELGSMAKPRNPNLLEGMNGK